MPIDINNKLTRRSPTRDPNMQGRSSEPQWRVVDRFYNTYYSGLDAKVYFGGVWVDEIINLSYQMQELVVPHFGYADYTARRFSHGQRSVDGSFTINFKSGTYIYQIMDFVRKSVQERKALVEAATNTAVAAIADEGDLGYEVAKIAASRDCSVDQFMAAIIQGTDGKSYDQDVIDKFNRMGWGPSTIDELNTKVTTTTSFDIPDELLYAMPSNPLMLTPPNSNGKYSSTVTDTYRFVQRVATLQRLAAGLDEAAFDISRDGFEIRIDFGEPPNSPSHIIEQTNTNENSYQDKKTGMSVGTTRRILGCELQGVQTAIDDSGRPTIESYGFCARTII